MDGKKCVNEEQNKNINFRISDDNCYLFNCKLLLGLFFDLKTEETCSYETSIDFRRLHRHVISQNIELVKHFKWQNYTKENDTTIFTLPLPNINKIDRVIWRIKLIDKQADRTSASIILHVIQYIFPKIV